MKKYFLLVFMTIFFLFFVIFSNLINSQNCPSHALATPKGNSLYLYFPTTSDSTFPEYGTTYGLKLRDGARLYDFFN